MGLMQGTAGVLALTALLATAAATATPSEARSVHRFAGSLDNDPGVEITFRAVKRDGRWTKVRRFRIGAWTVGTCHLGTLTMPEPMRVEDRRFSDIQSSLDTGDDQRFVYSATGTLPRRRATRAHGDYRFKLKRASTGDVVCASGYEDWSAWR